MAKLTREEKLERKRLYYQNWRAANRDKSRRATAEWRERNPDKSKAMSNRWKKENPAANAAINMRRKAAKLQRTVKWSDEDRIKAIYSEAVRITIETGIEHHVDHIYPLQGELVSGLHVENNLQILTARDNMSKGNRFVPTILSDEREVVRWLRGKNHV